MSEYKENTVGWQLSQLKEPLKSRALELVKEDETDEFLASSLTEAIDAIIDAHPWMDDSTFWRGVNDFFYGESQLDSEDENGWEMAKECAPDNWLKPKDGGEDKAIVDSPAPEIPVTGAMIEDFSKRVKWPITREIEAPERAVVGYEIPKPIDTIEKKHELRIKNLELVNKWQADEIEFLKGYIDLVIAKVGQMAPQVEMLEKRVQAFNEK